MGRFIIATFALLAWVFYEMSGGADFEPASARLTDVKSDPLKPAQEEKMARAEDPVEVTRVSLDLTSVDDVIAGRTKAPARLPQQTAEPAAETPRVTQGASVVILPSLIADAEPEPAADVVQVASIGATEVNFNDVRSVTANRVNVRGGPGTNFDIVGKLERGDRVEILEDNGNGWVRFEAVDANESGWLADFLLGDG